MTDSNEIGRQGEYLAKKYLKEKGMKFVTANWLCRMGEIDLIMKDGETIVFVEVKTRSNASYGEGVDWVDGQKQQKLIGAAKQYQQEEDYWGDARFDVVSILGDEAGESNIEHLEHAFEVI